MFKLGLDLHGVVDANPIFFVSLSKKLITLGYEVHIITGESYSEIGDDLFLFDEQSERWWTHYYSIDDDFYNQGIPFIIDLNGGRHYEDEIWDVAKAHYCEDHEISFHIDDSLQYLEYFKTPCYYYRNLPEDIENVQNQLKTILGFDIF